jgi:hypothetical protein
MGSLRLHVRASLAAHRLGLGAKTAPFTTAESAGKRAFSENSLSDGRGDTVHGAAFGGAPYLKFVARGRAVLWAARAEIALFRRSDSLASPLRSQLDIYLDVKENAG